MSFDGNSELAYLIRVHTKHCGLTFSVSPCTATGTECFNTQATCPVLQDYDEEGKDFWFIEPASGVGPVDGIAPYPYLSGPPSFMPGELDVSSGIGSRSSCSFTLADGPHHDLGVDPYLSERSYDPMEQGTFWGKWLARNRFYVGNSVTVYLGPLVDGQFQFDDAETFEFIIERIAGPTNGSVQFMCKDPLKLAEDDRALFPAPSSGQLQAEMEEGDTEFTLIPTGIGNLEYPSAGKVRIGDEILRFTRDGDDFTVVNEGGGSSTQGRGIDGTSPDSHDRDSTVQAVEDVAPQTVPDILEFLLDDIAGIDPDFIPKDDWDLVQADIGFLFSGQVSKPTGVTELVNQLVKSAGVFIWWDDRRTEIRISALKATPDIETLDLLTEGQFVAGSFSIARDEERRLSQVWYSRGLIDSTQSVTEETNYSTRLIQADVETESLYGQQRVRQVWARWTPRVAAAASWIVSGRTLSRYRNTPRKIRFALDNSRSEFWVGDILAVEHRDGQDATGATVKVPIQITRAMFNGRGRISYEALEYDVEEADPFPGEASIIIDQDSQQTIDLRQLYESTIGPVDPDDPQTVNVQVLSGVRIQAFPAIKGGFPAGWDVNAIIDGSVAGGAGQGGSGGDAIQDPDLVIGLDGKKGTDGGTAIVMHEPWELSGSGNIYGGSGGGGGGAGGASNNGAAGGGGGGGGQSLFISSGGNPGIAFGSDKEDGEPGSDGDQSGAGAGGSGGSATGASGGNGGAGGAWATDGSDASGATGDNTGMAGLKGLAGAAINPNGFTLTDNFSGTIIGSTS